MENSTQQVSAPGKSKWKKRLLLFLVTIIVLFVAFVFICGTHYSDGARTGVVIKASHKGFVFKTYEGELNLGGISEGDGTIMPNRIWKFSIPRGDSAVYNEIVRSQGKHVRLYYDEVLKVFFWQGDTPYMVTRIEIVK
ncbi:MAG: 6-phosphogluconate dehydrogenase [Bacteroidota bacterium]